jgi:hypothetical protein
MGVSLDIQTQGFDKALQKLEDLPREIRAQAARAINEAADKGVSIAKRELRNKGAIDKGLLRASTTVRRYAAPDDLEAIFGAGDAQTNEEGFNYALAVEFGTRPHFPPVKAVTGETESLDRWVETKLGVSSEESEGVAFQIARKIARYGTKEKPFMRPAKRQSAALLERALKSLLDDVDL